MDLEKTIIDLFKQLNFSDEDIDSLMQGFKLSFGGFGANVDYELLDKLNALISKEIRTIKKLNPALEAYNSDCYSSDKTKSIILKSLNKLIEKYPQNNIPIIYTTETMPSGYNCPSDIWKKLCSLNPFELKDYGHLDFINALLALEKEKIIAIKSFAVLYIGNKCFICKAIINYKKIIETNKNFDEKKFFWFDNKTLKLKIADGETKAINLSTTKKQGSDPYYLMFGLIELLKQKGIRKGIWLSADIMKGDIKREVGKLIKNKVIDDNWLKDTKANLLKNMPEDCENYIKISNYNRGTKCYTFELKMPK